MSSVSPAAKLKLVVPINFSKKSELALDFALKFSSNNNADVYLFHCIEAKAKDFSEFDRLNVEYMDRMKEATLQSIDRLSALGITPAVDSIHRRISRGKPAQEILQLTAGVSADMIIMGAVSNKSFKDLIQQAPCTLVLVREKDLEFVPS